MAHNLANNDGKAAMMYVGKVPWHGLGTALKEPATAAEAIEAAGMDWEVIKVPLKLKRCPSRYDTVKGKFAVIKEGVKPVDNEVTVLGIVGKGYKLLQNKDAFAWFDPIVGKEAAVYHTAGALGEGERVWILAKLPGEIRVVGDDIAQKYLLLSNSHDGLSSVQIKFTPIRVVCQNTLTMALRSGSGIRISHNSSMTHRLALAERNLAIITERFGIIENDFKSMAAVQLKEGRLADYVSLVFPDPTDKADENAKKRILQARARSCDLFETGAGNQADGVRGSLWAAYNGITDFIDHHSVAVGKGGRLNSIWFGNGYLTKARAFSLAMECAETWKN